MDLTRHTILIIDSDEGTREALAEVLTQEGLAAVAASDGQEAVQLLAERPLTLVIVEDELLDMDAVEFLKRKAAIPSIAQVPVIILSGRRNTPLLDGAVALVPKPFGIDDLLREIRKHLPDVTGPKAA